MGKTYLVQSYLIPEQLAGVRNKLLWHINRYHIQEMYVSSVDAVPPSLLAEGTSSQRKRLEVIVAEDGITDVIEFFERATERGHIARGSTVYMELNAHIPHRLRETRDH